MAKHRVKDGAGGGDGAMMRAVLISLIDGESSESARVKP